MSVCPSPRYVAERFLRLCKADTDAPVSLVALLDVLDVDLHPRAPRGCLGALALDPLALHCAFRGHWHAILFALAHEVAHLAVALYPLPRPHDEAFIAAVADAIQIPTAPLRRVVQCVGAHHLLKLTAAFPEARPSTIARRLAAEGHALAAVHLGRTRTLYHPPEIAAMQAEIAAVQTEVGRERQQCHRVD